MALKHKMAATTAKKVITIIIIILRDEIEIEMNAW
jgi:hypothetical protein